MPVYEYLCRECEGVFESIHTMKEANEPEPCPICDTEAERLMPSTFTAFVIRNGYPRRIPDRGTYWHLGKEVSYLPKRAKPNEHPELADRKNIQRIIAEKTSVGNSDDILEKRRKKREEIRKRRERQRDF